MDHLLFVAYLLLFAWLVTKIDFFIKSGLNSTQLIILFLLKVIAGIFYGWLGVYYGQQLQMVDTWYFHYNGLKQYQLLLNHPLDFITSLFHTNYDEGFSKFLDSKDSWWNDVKYLFFDKLLAVFNLFSLGNYYINVIFYSFLTFFGPIALYRVMKNVFPAKEQSLQIAIFLIPSFLFWNSGLHKDGLVFLSFALICYHVYLGLKEKKFSWQRCAILLLALFLMILRSFVLIILLPAVTAWLIAQKSKYKPVYVFGATYFICILFFFTAHYLLPNVNLMEAVAVRQQEFLDLHGNSSIKVHPLEPSFWGFIKNAPQSVALTVLRPYPTDVHHFFSLISCIETLLFLFLYIIFFLFKRKDIHLTPFLLFCLTLSITMFLMIGYTVNILGAIVRYRSIALPFLLSPIIAMTDWKRVKTFIYIKLFNNI
ncbi:hypothetical protein SY85_06320 [Flavisolibacter tropicus]|uniref:Glycosyltransferase RgtA/B/C/D-like domain-containing protein n=2 Tax=Flavisolibacter tropicus TaxID=1492898 RepID=A0A172TTH5_9BACT|nr:hypothetical protein SY85_06320 [Flavisolibacter tropicus]